MISFHARRMGRKCQGRLERMVCGFHFSYISQHRPLQCHCTPKSVYTFRRREEAYIMTIQSITYESTNRFDVWIEGAIVAL